MDKISKLKIVLSCVMFLEAKLRHNTTDVSQHSLCKRQPLPPYLQAAITNFTRIIIPSIPTLLILQAGLHINNRGGFQQCSLILLQFTPALAIRSVNAFTVYHSLKTTIPLFLFSLSDNHPIMTAAHSLKFDVFVITSFCSQQISLTATNLENFNTYPGMTSTTWLSKIKPAVLKYWVSISLKVSYMCSLLISEDLKTCSSSYFPISLSNSKHVHVSINNCRLLLPIVLLHAPLLQSTQISTVMSQYTL